MNKIDEWIKGVTENVNMHDESCPDMYYHIKTLLHTHKKTLRIIEIMKEALEWYADDKLWASTEYCSNQHLFTERTSGAELAQEALARAEKEIS